MDTTVQYYTNHCREGGDTGPALVALQEKASASSDLGTVMVGGVEYQRFPTPDVSKYQYDDTSGYYYDKVAIPFSIVGNTIINCGKFNFLLQGLHTLLRRQLSILLQP